MKHIIILAALSASLFGQDSPKPATVTITRVSIAQQKQLGLVGIQPDARDHFQVIVQVHNKGIRSVDVTLNISIDGQAMQVSQLAHVYEYGTNDGQLGKRCGAAFTFEVPDISRAVVLGDPVVIENPTPQGVL